MTLKTKVSVCGAGLGPHLLGRLVQKDRGLRSKLKVAKTKTPPANPAPWEAQVQGRHIRSPGGVRLPRDQGRHVQSPGGVSLPRAQGQHIRSPGGVRLFIGKELLGYHFLCLRDSQAGRCSKRIASGNTLHHGSLWAVGSSACKLIPQALILRSRSKERAGGRFPLSIAWFVLCVLSLVFGLAGVYI